MGKVKHWAIRIDINGENVLNIESGCLSGIDDITEYRQTILNCAEHLKSFIGTENTPFFEEENSKIAQQTQPEKCPVCENGTRYVPFGTSDGIKCKWCNGTGIQQAGA